MIVHLCGCAVHVLMHVCAAGGAKAVPRECLVRAKGVHCMAMMHKMCKECKTLIH